MGSSNGGDPSTSAPAPSTQQAAGAQALQPPSATPRPRVHALRLLHTSGNSSLAAAMRPHVLDLVAAVLGPDHAQRLIHAQLLCIEPGPPTGPILHHVPRTEDAASIAAAATPAAGPGGKVLHRLHVPLIVGLDAVVEACPGEGRCLAMPLAQGVVVEVSLQSAHRGVSDGPGASAMVQLIMDVLEP